MRRLLPYILAALAARSAHASVYTQQSTFTLPFVSMNAMDSDAVGNLYVLGLPSGAAAYTVASYATQGINPLFSFSTGVSSPAAFAVEGSGIVDVVEGLGTTGPLILKRFQNNGTFIGQTQYPFNGPYSNNTLISAAIDKVNQRIYLAYQQWVNIYCVLCLGCPCPPSGTEGFIVAYDFAGNFIKSVTMPGKSSTGGCYTPSQLTVDPQGNFYVADATCQQLLKYSSSGSLLSQTAASKWTYNFSPRGMWTDAASSLYISQPNNIVKLGSDQTVQTSLAADSPTGCAWDQRILYLSSSGGEPIKRFVYNGPPSVAAQSGPLGTVVQHSSSAYLNWQSSNDPDGDPINYTVLLANSPTQLPPIGSTSQTSLTSQPLAFGTTYYWQVLAQASYLGLPLQTTPSPVVSFNLNLVNSPPGSFGVLAGTGTVVTRATSVTLAWQNAIDPDGDPVAYDVLWQTPSQTAMSVIGTTSQTSWQMTGLSFGATYYWSVRARDVYNAWTLMAGGIPQPYHPVFQDTPPPVPAIVSGTGTMAEHTFSPQAILAWSNVLDADGDPVAYRLYLGTSPAGMALVQDGTATSYNLTAAQLGTTYYWQVSAYDPYAASTTGVQSLLFVLQDSPPSAVVYLTTATSFAQHTTSPAVALSWAPSTDPDGDSVSYRLDVQTSTGSWPSIPMGSATNITLNTQLETTYYWRVTAYDAFAASTGAWMSFIVHLANRPPYPIVYSSPATITTRATSYTLSWQNTGDPDGDPVSYALFLSTNSTAQYLVQQGTSTAYPLNFQFGTTYYWYVTATDSFGAQTSGLVQTFLPVFQDTPPPSPPIVSGSGTMGQHTLTPSATLAWSSVVDADGDPVSYRLAVGTNPAALALVQEGSGLSYNLPSPLFGTTYYWQVTAYDPYAATSTPIQSLYLYLKNSPPLPFPILTGSGTVSTRNTSQLLSWQNAVDPDGDLVTYDLALSTTPGALPIVQSSTATSFTLATQFGATYYWQVTARDGFGGSTLSGLQTLAVVFRNSPPTIPVNQSKTGTIPYHGFGPAESFFWQPSTDPDGDPFAYSLQIGTDATNLSTISPVPLGYTVSNLALNTAYYFRIVATDIYGAASPSPTNWVYYQFYNNPPGPFDVLAATGTVVTRATTAGLAWTLSTDPDGDMVTYRVFGGTSAASVTALGDTTQPNFTLANLGFGTTYYWRVDAYDGFGGTTTVNGGTQSLLYIFKDLPPATPVYLTTATVFGLHTTSPTVTLAWAASADPDGDSVTYMVDVRSSTGAWPSVMMGSSTSLTLSPLFETTYYWRVTAVDPYASTAGPWQSLVAHFVNHAPGMPTILSGAGVSSQHTLTPSAVLSWSAVTDPDGDPVAYALSVGTTLASMAPALLGSSTSFALPNPQFGTTYYWQVSARDNYGAASSAPVQTLILALLDNPPLAFAVLTGSGTASTRATSQVLSWQPTSNLQGDVITYGLFLSTTPAPLPTLQISTATSFMLAFQYGTTYYWRVDAYDGFGGTTTVTGGVQTFLPLFLNDPPAQVNLISPFKGSPVVTTMRDRVSVSWQQVTTPQGDPVGYTVYLGQSPSSLDVLTRISQTQTASGLRLAAEPNATRPQSDVQLDGDSIKLTLSGLDYYKSYYFRVVATNPYGASSQTPLQTFTLSAVNGFPKAYNYPNPFNPSRGGTHIVFNAPPSGYSKATVSIYSELQDLLFQREYPNIAPGVSHVDFDGRDRYGRAFFNGSYICRVRFEGPDDKETFYLMVVK